MKPSATHPWRNYANRPQPTHNGDVRLTNKSLQIFLEEITSSWQTIQLPLKYRGRFDNWSLLELPDKIIAFWLISMLRRYINAKIEIEDELDQI